MTSMRLRIEKWFEEFGRMIFRNRVKAILIMLLLTFPAVLHIPKMKIDTTNESFFHKNDAALLAYNEFRDQYGKDEIFIIAVNPPDVFDLKFLRKLKGLHEELSERVPYLDDITSLINARNIRGEGDTLIVEDLMEAWPDTEEQVVALKERVLSNPLYINTVISEDAQITAIILKAQTYISGEVDILSGFEDQPRISPGAKSTDKYYLSNEQNIEMVDAIEPILRKYDSPDFRVYFAGTPAVVAALDKGIRKTLMTFMPLTLLIVAIFLFIMFRRISGVVYPFFIMIISLLATLGLMAAMRIPMTNVTQILPTFLLVVGVGDSVHILAVFYLRFKETSDKEESIAYSLGHSGLAVLMTSLTTAVGLSSFVTADVAPIEDLGIIAPIGVMLALLYTVVLLPAFLALFPVKKFTSDQIGRSIVMDKVLSWIAGISYGHPLKIIVACGLLVVLSVVGILNLKFSHNGLKWLPEDLPVRKATELLDEKLKGTLTLEVVIDTGRENGLHEPEILNRLEESVQYSESLQRGEVYVGKAWTLSAILKEINRALNEDKPEFYSIPQDKQLVAQEFLLFESSGSDDLEEVVDSEFRKARFTMKAPFRDAIQYKEKLFDSVRDHFMENYPDAHIEMTGVIPLFIAMIHNLITTMAKSYIIALSIITILMMLLIGRVRIGMLSMVPNLVPILIVLGLMGWRSIPMDLSNILVGSVAIGLVVDDTIHFMHNFRRYFEESGDAKNAVSLTLHTTGRAILVTSIVLSCGFFILMFAEMRNTYFFGLLTGSSVVLALIADFFLAPALMTLVHRGKSKNRH